MINEFARRRSISLRLFIALEHFSRGNINKRVRDDQIYVYSVLLHFIILHNSKQLAIAFVNIPCDCDSNGGMKDTDICEDLRIGESVSDQMFITLFSSGSG